MKKVLSLMCVMYSLCSVFAQAPGNAFSFDGDNDLWNVSYTAKFGFTNALTLECWVQNKGIVDWAHIVSKHFDASVWCLRRSSSTNTISFSAANTEVTSTTSLNTGTWYHVAGVFDGSTVKIYVNGVLEASAPSNSATLKVSSNSIYIGGTIWNNRCWNGSIDELRIWNVARTQAEIQASMYNVVNPASSGLVAYYKFDQGVAGGNNNLIFSLTDATSSPANGSRLILSDITATGPTSNWVESYAMVVPLATSGNPGGNHIIANWTAPAVGIVDNYILDVSTSPVFSSFVNGYNNLVVPGTMQVVSGLSANTDYYYRVRADKASVTGSGGFSNTIIINSGALLAATWQSFTAKLQADGVILLEWKTLDEENVKEYILQHSIDGSNWGILWKMKASAGSNNVSTYNYIHSSPAHGKNFYRVMQNDHDGKTNFSNVIHLSSKQELSYSLYPNPVTDGKLHIEVNKPCTMHIYTNNGRQVFQYNLLKGHQVVNVSAIGKGVFSLRVGKKTQQLVIR